MNPEDFYNAKRKSLFWVDMIFYLILCFFLALGVTIVYWILKLAN